MVILCSHRVQCCPWPFCCPAQAGGFSLSVAGVCSPDSRTFLRELNARILPNTIVSPRIAMRSDVVEGGIGAVLFRDGGNPYTYGGMIPEHLAYQLISIQETEIPREQRNKQAQLLAILIALLMWQDGVKGCS